MKWKKKIFLGSKLFLCSDVKLFDGSGLDGQPVISWPFSDHKVAGAMSSGQIMFFFFFNWIIKAFIIIELTKDKEETQKPFKQNQPDACFFT